MIKKNDFEIKLDDAQKIGKIVRQYRREKKVTQVELAGFSNLSRLGVVKLEKAQSDIKLSTLIKVVGLLGFDLVLRKRDNA